MSERKRKMVKSPEKSRKQDEKYDKILDMLENLTKEMKEFKMEQRE